MENKLPNCLAVGEFLRFKADLCVNGNDFLCGAVLHKNHQTYRSHADNIGDDAGDDTGRAAAGTS